jgi:23S rRNA (uracil1939-C5)-methyltransferase
MGFHIPGTFSKVFDVEKCFIQPSLGNNILNEVRKFIKDSDKSVYSLKTHRGFWRYLMLRYSFAYNTWMVNIITAHKDLHAVSSLAKSLTDKFANISSIVNNVTKKKSGAAIGDYETCLYGADHIKECIGKYEFKISANSFFQTNTKGAAILYKVVKEYAALTGCETVVDLYCGTGTISIFLSSLAKEVTGLEISKTAVNDARENCLNNNILNCKFISGDIKKTMVHIKKRPDVLIIDPPRSGMHKDVVLQILCMEPAKIIYVSCNPSTLARDIKLLSDKYRPVKVQPVDMFPHTYHIESVMLLLKR